MIVIGAAVLHYTAENVMIYGRTPVTQLAAQLGAIEPPDLKSSPHSIAKQNKINSHFRYFIRFRVKRMYWFQTMICFVHIFSRRI